MGCLQPIHFPRLSPAWATLLLNVVALTYSTNGVFVKTIESANVKPLPSLVCAVRFLIATLALAILSKVFTSKPGSSIVVEKDGSPPKAAGSFKSEKEENEPLRSSDIQLSNWSVQPNLSELGTPRNRRARKELPHLQRVDGLFDIPLDSTKGTLRSSPRLSPFGCGPGGWHHSESSTPVSIKHTGKANGLTEAHPECSKSVKPDNQETECLMDISPVKTETPLSPVVASLELGVLMFLGFATQAVALETAMAGHVALLTCISVILVPALESIGGKPWRPATMIATSLSFIGTGLLEHKGKGLGLALPSLGDTWGILSSIAFAIHVVRSEVYAKSWRAASKRQEEAEPKQYTKLATESSKFEDQRSLQGEETGVYQPWSPVFLVLVQTAVVTGLSVAWWVLEISMGLCHEEMTDQTSHLGTATWLRTFVLDATWQQLAHMPWMAMVYTGVVSTGMCEWLEFHCLQSVRASTCVLIYSAISIYGAFFAWLLRGEVLGFSGFVGAAVVICASVWVQLAELWAAKKEDESGTSTEGT